MLSATTFKYPADATRRLNSVKASSVRLMFSDIQTPADSNCSAIC